MNLFKYFIFILTAVAYCKGTKSLAPEAQTIKKVFSEKNIKEHILYPSLIKDYSVSGISVVEFYVDNYGDIKNVEIIKSLGQPFDDAILSGLESFISQEMFSNQFSKEFRYRLPIFFKN
tara:strand:- start:252 stop:608 length:357 start_codon:yes stop_codon:yes gene_type:complete